MMGFVLKMMSFVLKIDDFCIENDDFMQTARWSGHRPPSGRARLTLQTSGLATVRFDAKYDGDFVQK